MKINHALISASLAVSFFVLLTGCGNPNLGQVSGTVTYDGRPLDNATVSFLPEAPDGMFAVATTDAQGHYELVAPIVKRGKSATQGAMAGRYRVTISKKEADLDPDEQLYTENKITYDELLARRAKKTGGTSQVLRDVIPARYGNVDSSGLRAEVKAKTRNEFHFDLEK
ncbi:MAG TPA: hypothetical protein DEB39_11290 [Planctomycetaceae bacterium]|nr:hypothetical protein [Planctomycetaceae bacterium]